jgi:hypothetical protein
MKTIKQSIKENKEVYYWYAFESTYKEGIDAAKVKEVVIWSEELIKKIDKIKKPNDIPFWLTAELDELRHALKDIRL